ncbi:unnamed protein product [Allacma fusca]|uniref:Uncharacterized protein n=1 Tax=Allacma fusca TaxID=39272 RepID=A0A8J2NKV2_9HEXA|nr:unnamed protein product [Allacma fusca]
METSVSPLFMKIENNKHPQKKKHTPSPVGAVLEDEDEEEEELLKLYDQEKKQSHNKNKKKMLRRRSSLSAEIEGSFDSSKVSGKIHTVPIKVLKRAFFFVAAENSTTKMSPYWWLDDGHLENTFDLILGTERSCTFSLMSFA